MQNSKPTSTPGAVSTNLSQFDGEPFPNASLYRSIGGALQYVTITRPHLSYAINKASQFMANPTTMHWLVLKRILQYLKGSTSLGLILYPSSSLDIQTYTDADWASCPDDRRSTTGYCIFLGSNLVSQSSTKQKVMSRSSAKSEYCALAATVAEVTWIRFALPKFCISLPSPPLVWCDNQSATQLAANLVFHAQSKHIEIDLHFRRNKVLQHALTIQYIYPQQNKQLIFLPNISQTHQSPPSRLTSRLFPGL